MGETDLATVNEFWGEERGEALSSEGQKTAERGKALYRVIRRQNFSQGGKNPSQRWTEGARGTLLLGVCVCVCMCVCV